MRESLSKKLSEILLAIEQRSGYVFEPDDLCGIVDHTNRKIELNGAGKEYLPILFENELRDFLMRLAINAKGAKANV